MDITHGRRKVVIWVAAIATVAGVTIAAFAIWGDRSEPDPTLPKPTESVASDGCTGVTGQSIELDGQVVDPEPRTCFELTEAAQVTIGAAALEPSDLISLTLLDAEGDVLATAVSETDWDPTVGLQLAPGTYVIEVAGADAEQVPPFLLHTATFPPSDESGDDAVPGTQILPGGENLPAAASCGTEVPWLATGAPVAVSIGATADAAAGESSQITGGFACVEVTAAVLAKIGIESADPYGEDSPDLTLAVYHLREGAAELIRVGDDTFGSDPEVSLDLEPGTYLVEGAAWHGAQTPDFEFYYDDGAQLFRKGEVTVEHGDLVPAVCADAPTVSPGDTVTVTGERTYTCMDVSHGERLTIQAATLTDQDLALEVMGFNGADPYRLAWTDDNPHSQALIDFDPLLDQHIPAGQWVIAVTTYYGEAAADYDLRVVSGEGS